MRKIILEVGANDGREVMRLLNQYPDAEYYGFEPTIELYVALRNHFAELPRVHFLPFALSDYAGFGMFNVAGQSDWGCSSLFNFPANIHEIWPNRPDFNVTHRYTVPIITMKQFLEIFIEPAGQDYEIVYAWIDAQGSDVQVLKGFGDRITKMKAGRIEVAYSTELYEGTQNRFDVATEFLNQHNYVFNVLPDGDAREANLEFRIKE